LIKREGNSEGSLVRLHLVVAIHLVGYAVKDDGADDCSVCFAACEYVTSDNVWSLGGSLLPINK
jgi:hypothetical protein